MSDPVVFIPLTKGQVAVVDFADFEKVRGYLWRAHPGRNTMYAARSIRRPGGKKANILIHQAILPGIPCVDHRDGDGLNNCRDNLRPATNSQNQRGLQQKRKGATSRFRGVSWYTRHAKWQAQITVNKTNHPLGYFASEEEAARAYDTAARIHFGEFASPNFS